MFNIALRRARRLSSWRLPPWLGLIAAFVAGCYLLAQSALSDLDALVEQGPDAIRDAPHPLSAPKDWALFLTAQVVQLRQPGDDFAHPGRIFRDCADCPDMVEIPAGYYLMGSPLVEIDRFRHLLDPRPMQLKLRSLNREGPRRLVTIAKGFAMARFELTVAEWNAAQLDPDWQRITGLAPRVATPGQPDEQALAVTGVSRDDAIGYAAWLSARTGQSYRVPSEAEWEYAARAGTTTARHWGDSIGHNRARCKGCGDDQDQPAVGRIGQYAANGFGLYDMIGNGREWVLDCFRGTIGADITDGSAFVEKDCMFGVTRGESSYAESWRARSAYRVGPHHYNRRPGATIRLVRDLD